MRIANLFLLMILSVTVSFAQNGEPYLVKDFSGQRIDKIETTTSGGSIKVNGGAKTARVKVFVRSNNWNNKLSDREIEERLQNYTLEVKMDGNKLICYAKPKSDGLFGNNNRLSISFEIDSPEKVNTDLATSGGSITLSRLDGDLNFRTSGGSLSLTELRGKVKGATSGGSIKLSDLHGDVSLSTSGGSITADKSDGTLKLSTSGGSLNFNDLKGKIVGQTSGGSIKAHNVKGDLSISTSGGSIKFSNFEGNLNGSTSGGGIEGNIISIKENVSLVTSAGSIKVDLPFNEGLDLDLKGNRVYSDKLAKVSNTLKQGKVNGRVNGGGKTVRMKTSSGSIYVD